MIDVSKSLDEETLILIKRIGDLYNDYHSKVKYFTKDGANKPALPIIEELTANFNSEVSLLENEYKQLCIKLLVGKN